MIRYISNPANLLGYLHLHLPTPLSCNRNDKLVVNLNRIDVLKMSKFTNHMLLGKFGYFLNFPGQVTDEKVYYPLQKFTNKIVLNILFQEIDHEPSIGVSVDIDCWMNSPIEFF